MFFFIKKSKIIVDSFTYNNWAYKEFTIKKSNEFYPEWLKNTPKEFKVGVKPVPTIRTCEALIQNFKTGLIIPMWSDFAFKSTEDKYEYQFADGKSTLDSHSQQQWGKFADPKIFNQIKLISPYALKTKEDIFWNYTYPFWNNGIQLNYFLTPGILSFKHQHGTNINLFVHAKSNFFIKAGDPIVHLIPLTEKNVEIKNHLIDENEFTKMLDANAYPSFKNRYAKLLKTKTKKCPFGFGK
jgi:hypothetical protein